MVHSLLKAPIRTHGLELKSASETDRTPRSCAFLPFCAISSENCENACASASATYRSHIGTMSCSERVANSGGGFCLSGTRSEEHTSELQSLRHLVCRL